MTAPTTMTFFARFERDILAGKKVITIRDASEKDYQPGTVVDVSTLEEGRWFCRLHIESVEPVQFSALTAYHAEQENMTLDELKQVISDIYPGIEELYVITYQLVE
ncbi:MULTISPECIES: N(4)-acetylcytidine aminohydrolase [Vibrio]|uniref:N(4)-acetylcytidine aminohydrolase n=1 Tax=Vibrio TaxID=662 RepID=UPI0012ADE54E|nr:N(4)-acetylcytidine aminohydrolase [Vibrio furnissii]MCG6212709.1 N(4)-acetylcytidine aminohydrolase [Vibrio furnissii]MCG6227235.1 N(4)-acetylcytidine aminohydrolase [Vibrio furnissii]MCG6232174.1 N(4)-acetylcytidine aminohydrolase [Vibrio furnissii]MCG6260619.1 N(4)-acetylcytidine aminohydrolase [Vibrio furnissii]MCG6267207.1 N(4)-acetylcytidine aminohydrolase [Vibrio furnissii]